MESSPLSRSADARECALQAAPPAARTQPLSRGDREISAVIARCGFARVSRRSLAGCIALLCMGAVPQTAGAVIPVGRCVDMVGKGGYTLRQAIGLAPEGDTVDLSTLPVSCSTITLTGGAIPIVVDNLTIQGPADRTITVSGNNAGRIFNHSGSGILRLNNLTLSGGNSSGSGGCVVSYGQVWLYAAAMNACSAAVDGGCIDSVGETFLNHQSSLTGCSAALKGGGIHALGPVVLNASSISGSSAYDGAAIDANAVSATVALLSSSLSGNTASSEGGAIVAYGDVDIGNSVISGNVAGYNCGGLLVIGSATLTSSTVAGNVAETGSGGGVFMRTLGGAAKTLTLNSTTVSGNSAHLFGGGVEGHGNSDAPYGPDMHFSNSTISGNSAGGGGGGVRALFGRTRFANSTVAFNDAPVGGGFYATSPFSPPVRCFVEAHSSLFTSNTGSTFAPDINLNNNCAFMAATTPDNLIDDNGSNSLTTDIWFHGPGRLAPLAYHGGPVRIHALLADSGAINRGSNPDNLSYDQRGPGFDRSVGLQADIGAYERQLTDDEIFYDGME